MSSFLKEYDIRKIALTIIFLIILFFAVIGVIYRPLAQLWSPFTPQISSLPTGESIQQNCENLDSNQKDICFIGKAIDSNDVSICSKVINSQFHDSCLDALHASARLESCDSYFNKDNCFFDNALNSGDSSLCIKIIDLNQRNDCYFYTALDKNNASICDGIESEIKRDDCYSNISFRTNNPEACAKIIDLNKHDSCLLVATLADTNMVYSNDLCLNLKTTENKDYCFNNLARQENNSNLCDSIISTDLKKNCFNMLGVVK